MSAADAAPAAGVAFAGMASKALATTPPQFERRRPGRPTKLTYALGDRIVELIAAGNYVETAAAACGLAKTRFYLWADRAADWDEASSQEIEDLYADAQFDEQAAETLMFIWFRHAYKEAEATAERNLLAEVAKAQTGWQASMTILQRRFGPKWREKTALDIDVTGDIRTRRELTETDVKDLQEAFGMPAAAAVAAGPDAVQPPAEDD